MAYQAQSIALPADSLVIHLAVNDIWEKFCYWHVLTDIITADIIMLMFTKLSSFLFIYVGTAWQNKDECNIIAHLPNWLPYC